GDRAGELRPLQRPARRRGAGRRDRAGKEDIRVNEERRIEAEEVEGVASPPKARVADVAENFARKRDYLEGFLSHKPAARSDTEPGGALFDAVIEALKDIYDPEIPVNIYDLGLVYDVTISPEHHVKVVMT